MSKSKKEFKISEELYSSEDTFTEKDKSSFLSLVKFLEEKQLYVAQNFEEFLSLLKKKAGLVILFVSWKMTEIRNNMIRAINNILCIDILKNSVIFPVMTETTAGEEFIKVLKPQDYPVYLFCKYKDSQVMTISAKVEKKFRMDNIISNLLDSFPENDVKQSIYQSINTSIINFKSNNPPKNEDDDDFSGDENEVNTIVNKLKKSINFGNTIFPMRNNNTNNYNDYNYDNKNDKNDDDNPFKPSVLINNRQPENNNINTNNNVNNNNNTGNNRFKNLFGNDQTLLMNKGPNQNISPFGTDQTLLMNKGPNQNINPFGTDQTLLMNRGPNQNRNPFGTDQTLLINNNPNVNQNPFNSPSFIGFSEEMKKKQEAKRKQEENKKQEEKKKFDISNKSIKAMPIEPPENDANACKISFRFPFGLKCIERRFYKNEKIETLYAYVKCLGNEIYSNPIFRDFDLVYGHPATSFENKKHRTLEEEGLYPSAIINIVEKLKY